MRESVVLSDVAMITASIVDPTDAAHSSLPHVSAEHITSITGELLPLKSAAEDGMESGKYLFDTGDVLYSKLRPYLRKATVVNFAGLCSADIYPIKTDTNRLCPEYLRLILTSDRFTAFANEASTRSRMPKLNREQLFAYECELPSVDEQRRIAAHLKAQHAAIEEARQAAQAQLEELESLKTLALNDVFSKTQNTCQIGDVAKVQSGYAFKSQDFRTSGIRLLRNTNILPGRVYWDDTVFFAVDKVSDLSSYVICAGDVIVSLDRPIISSGIKVARVAAHDLPALLVQRVGRFLLDANRLDADYLYAFLQTTRFIEAISGHDQSLGVPHISPGQVEAVEIPLPSIAEQRRLAFIANELLKTTDQAQIATFDMLSDISVLPARILAQAFEDH